MIRPPFDKSNWKIATSLASAVIASMILAGSVEAQSPGRDIAVEAMRTEKRLALVIGNGAYPTAPLRNPVSDARAMARTLRGLGFEVLAHENVGQKAMLRAILEFGDRLRGSGVGLLYFSGHGLQVGGKNFMIPTDAAITAEPEVEVEAVDVARVLARMETAKNRLNIVILDACRDNPFGRSFRSTDRGLASIDAPSGTLIAYATAPGRLARDGEGANSPYTGELLKAIQLPGLKIEDVFKRVRQAVQQKTQGTQVPWEASSLVGDFIFTLAAVGKVTPSAPATEPPTPRVTPPDVTPSSQHALAPVIKGGDGAEMVLVAAGEFWMGTDRSDGNALRIQPNEQPKHRVYLDAYYIDKYEVTNAHYQVFSEATERAYPWFWRDDRVNSPTQPVVGVTWDDAETYCRWAGKRLPTEAEWEKAARGADGRTYPWGDKWELGRANAPEPWDGYKTAPVGSYPGDLSPYGAYDMAGNAWEWVADWYENAYYEKSPARNPAGPASGSRRVLRGGSFRISPVNLRSAIRMSQEPNRPDRYIGFRCAKGLP